jgi:hypothetical protein
MEWSPLQGCALYHKLIDVKKKKKNVWYEKEKKIFWFE